jgi:hypothetical protein
MTAEGDTWYKTTIESDVKITNIIFNNNSGSQTNDLTFNANNPYYSNSWKSSKSAGSNVIYLKPNSNWKQSNAWFAAYFFNNSTNKNSWAKMVDSNGDGIFEAIVPTGTWPNVLFCRMNSGYNVLSWDANGKDYVWNQTSDLTYSTSYNYYTVKEGTWDKGGGSWSKKS